MSNEIELKLSLPVSAQRLLLRQSVLNKAVGKRTHQLINLYYDTPTLDLHRHGIALRLRKQGHVWLQTVKCAGNSVAGLSTRPEWEIPYAGHFDFSSVDADPVRCWLERPQVRANILPLFETNFRRTTWRFEPRPGCVLLLMLDRGWIAADGRRETISEVEIELASDATPSNISELFLLAQTLGDRLTLIPALRSKAERGYHIFLDRPLQPHKARTAPLLATLTPLDAFRRIAFECLEHLQGNYDGALVSEHPDPEFIHQMRVATRRLRAALRTFAPGLPPALATALLPPLRTLTGLLGRARDFDVLLAEIAAPVMHGLPDEPRLAALAGSVTNQQCAAHAEAIKFLQSKDYGQFLLLATALLHHPPFAPDGSDEAEEIEPVDEMIEPLIDFATRQLKRLRKKLRASASASDIEDPVSLHRLRIAIKRLRYALEFLAPLAAGKSLQRLLKQLMRLQDELGQLNDLANAGLLLMRCAGNDPQQREAVALIGGWHIARYRAVQARIARQMKKIAGFKLPRLA